MVCSLAGLLWVFRHVDLPILGQTLRQAKFGWIGAALAIFGIGFAAAAARWHAVLGLSKRQVHATATARAVMIGHLFNTLLFGPTGGDLAKSALYARWFKFDLSSILSTCVLDRSLGGIGFFIFAACAPGFAVYSGHWRERATKFIWSPRFAVLAAITMVLLLVGRMVRRRWPQVSPLRHLSAALFSNTAALLRHPRIALRGLGFAMLSHLAISCVFLFSLKAVTHTPFSWASVFWVFPVISMITSAPVTVSGAGLREGAALYFLGLYGIPGADAVAASLLVLFSYLVWALFAGWVLWRAELKREQSPFNESAKTLSIVIPTLNEALALPETIKRARQVPEVLEIIVVDAGSTDGTLKVAEQLGCRTLPGSGGRGGQLRVGAAQARGDVVVLLHADTWLPPESGEAILNCLRDQVVVAGGFWKVFREKSPLMAGSRLRCALRLLLFRRIMGDQVLFVRRSALEAIGGVPAVPLMEEFELCKRLNKIGSLALASATVSTSARRFAKLGVVRTYLRMGHVTARYYLGTPAHELRALYEQD